MTPVSSSPSVPALVGGVAAGDTDPSSFNGCCPSAPAALIAEPLVVGTSTATATLAELTPHPIAVPYSRTPTAAAPHPRPVLAHSTAAAGLPGPGGRWCQVRGEVLGCHRDTTIFHWPPKLKATNELSRTGTAYQYVNLPSNYGTTQWVGWGLIWSQALDLDIVAESQ